ncbi:MAG: YidB family protein [Verrucomicrobium sp.]
MSLLGDLANQLLSGSPGEESELPAGAAQAAPGGVNLLQIGAALLSQSGGLEGLMAKFQQGGLGDLISSWVGTGRNLPVSADQIVQVLGHDQVQQVATDAGVDTQTAATGLAQILPGLIDKLTPGGESVSGDTLQHGLSALLSGDFKRFLG